MKIYKCKNQRPKPHDPKATCGRMIGRVTFKLPDNFSSMWCPTCHVFNDVTVHHGNMAVKIIEKSEANFVDVVKDFAPENYSFKLQGVDK